MKLMSPELQDSQCGLDLADCDNHPPLAVGLIKQDGGQSLIPQMQELSARFFVFKFVKYQQTEFTDQNSPDNGLGRARPGPTCPGQTRLDQARPVQTVLDQTPLGQVRPDQHGLEQAKQGRPDQAIPGRT